MLPEDNSLSTLNTLSARRTCQLSKALELEWTTAKQRVLGQQYQLQLCQRSKAQCGP